VKIVVPVKQVADLDEDFVLLPDGSGVDPESIDWELNEWDRFAVEAALQLREAHEPGSCEVVVVSVGEDEAGEALLASLAMGADRAMHARIESTADRDSLSTAHLLARLIGPERPDLILCGVQSKDAANGATGVALSGLLDLRQVAVVNKIELEAGTPPRLKVQRELEGGLLESLRVPLPALLTVQSGTNEPRYANLRAIKLAREKATQVFTLADLGLTSEDLRASSGATRTSLQPPDRAASAVMLSGSAQELAGQILTIVEERLNS